MPNYTKSGKILNPISDSEFKEGIEKGHFVAERHKAFCILLFYSAVRCSEALRSLREQYQLKPDRVIFDVGKRLKHGKETPALHLPVKAPYMKGLYEAVESTRKGKRVFPYCRATAYNIVARAFKYPHLFRLTRITNFFLEGWTIPQIQRWTGLTLNALDFYVGLADIMKMGESLAK